MSEDLKDFGSSFKKFMDQMVRDGSSEQRLPFFVELLNKHFQAEAPKLPVISYKMESYQHSSFQRALDTFLATQVASHQEVGYRGFSFGEVQFASLLSESEGTQFDEGPVTRVTLELGAGETTTVIDRALVLCEMNDGSKQALLISGPSRHAFSLVIEVMAPDQSAAQKTIHYLRDETARRSVYRGKVLTLDTDEYRQLSVRIMNLPPVDRSNIILPAGILERVERLTVYFGSVRERMLAAGRHLRRGMLLHGSPGTGKTYTAMYLASAMPDRTVLMLTGRSQGLIETCCAMARTLEPAMVVIEDVDLIATERSQASNCTVSLLFELLNQMDGLSEDCDVLFLLTTNRPDILEPALSARPGRIDQAIMIPLPDAECRRRLFELYSRGMKTDIRNIDTLIARTEGASAAFIKELMRRAALFACRGDNEELCVRDEDIDTALHELVADGGPLTRSLLGFDQKQTAVV